ncbi:hypothetical protein F511_36829 [Dorcoceras hygrometricum]|uniref:Uncharacterized protein n=1 Tax=Dorcoceras hygrometricum TaxID=472368 RepID=A0A2Z7CT93_9LAMI|nr:hypothetical protein F511_36829 [Dorcoceras hygrometricum]
MHSRDRAPTFASYTLLRPPLAGAPPAGPPPGPAGPKLTDPSPNHGRNWTHEAWKQTHGAARLHTLHGVFHLAHGSSTIPPLRTPTSHP